MTTKNQEPDFKRLSIAMHPSVANAVEEIAKDENRSFSSQLRSFVNEGLKTHGIKVRGNQVVQ